MYLIGLLIWISVFLITVTIHEVSHGLIAYVFGDKTAYRMGRLSFNPLKHIDPFGTVILPIMLMMMGAPPIGIAKPVPVDFMQLRNPKKHMVLVAFAGPLVNLLFAALLAALFQVKENTLILFAIYFNIGIAVFNLMPIPPLDGGRILAGLLPNSLAYRLGKIEPFGFLIIMGLLWLGLLHQVIIPIMNMVCTLYNVPGIRI
jgi:Zn-dependent protease